MAIRTVDAALRSLARAWVQDDPDPATRVQLAALLERVGEGDAAAGAELADCFAGTLAFGTAGLRGALGAGPNRMNRSVVIRAAAGLTAYLQHDAGEGGTAARPGGPFVVVGYDARHNSEVFARDTAAVVVGAGGRAAVLLSPLPTPVLAFAIRHLDADAGVMVTASHNPARDNGYKVYLGDGAQIAPPDDTLIASRIAAVPSVAAVPRAGGGWETLGGDVLEAYLDAVAGVVAADSPRDLAVVHTALHGVGDDTVRAAFERAGFAAPRVVPSQARPDPDFPTVPFPNPEEAETMDAALELARRVRPDLVIATDPDADRCAAAVLDGGRWRMLRGDEVGVLLGAHLIARGVARGAVFASSIVSSRLLAAVAGAAGVRHEQTLTGFKWIARVPGLRYGYEEALGYCVAPETVRDKDGVSAALLLAELAATLKARGRSLLDLLDDLAVAHGVHATDSFSVRVSDLGQIPPVMERLRRSPPPRVAGCAVAALDDLSTGDGGLPPTVGVRLLLADGSRVIVRPSGTEPKIKVYLEVVMPVTHAAALPGCRATADRRLEALRADLQSLTRA